MIVPPPNISINVFDEVVPHEAVLVDNSDSLSQPSQNTDSPKSDPLNLCPRSQEKVFTETASTLDWSSQEHEDNAIPSLPIIEEISLEQENLLPQSDDIPTKVSEYETCDSDETSSEIGNIDDEGFLTMNQRKRGYKQERKNRSPPAKETFLKRQDRKQSP